MHRYFHTEELPSLAVFSPLVYTLKFSAQFSSYSSRFQSNDLHYFWGYPISSPYFLGYQTKILLFIFSNYRPNIILNIFQFISPMPPYFPGYESYFFPTIFQVISPIFFPLLFRLSPQLPSLLSSLSAQFLHPVFHVISPIPQPYFPSYQPNFLPNIFQLSA